MTYTQINSLWSLEDVDDSYFFCHEDRMVYNKRWFRGIHQFIQLPLHFDNWHYVTVSVKRWDESDKTIFYHKIIALTLINNGPYELIEHLDDDPTNNSVSNLYFSDKRQNGFRAFANGKHIHKSSTFEFCMEDGTVYRGTIREVSKASGIPEGTLYDRIYTERPCTSRRTKYRFQYIKELTYGTTRGYNKEHDKLIQIPEQYSSSN